MSEICRVCRRPLDEHAIELRDGVAHTVVYEGGRRRFCSAADGERQYSVGQAVLLLTLVRSLRMLAGRSRTAGQEARAAALTDYSYKLEADRQRLIRNLGKWYAWKEWNEP